MKKYFIFAAAAVTFVACTEDVLIDNTKAPENNNEVAIGFGSDINKLVMTRADDTAENSKGTLGEGLENYHYTFRIWGYKNIKNATATPQTYTSTPVFDGDKNNEKTVATWSPAGNNTAPFNTKNDNLGGGDWVYSPVRYWDKTATNYDFHAAAPHMDSTQTNPIALDWQWKQINIDEDNNPTAVTDATVDAKGAGYFTLGTSDKPFKLNGESLPLANATSKTDASSKKNVTTQPNDVFGGKKGTLPAGTTAWETKDVDLMIAKDVLENPANHSSKTNGNGRVTFNFNHILSRLNIGVKIDGIAVKQMVNYDGVATKYLLYTADDGKNYIKNENSEAQEVTLNSDNKTITNAKNGSDDVPAVAWNGIAGIRPDDNVPNPTEGVVLLKDIEVVNLVTNGCFDEGVLAYKDDASKAMNENDGTAGKPMVKPSKLVNGTNLRWTFVTEPAKTSLKASDKISDNSTYGFPNEKVTGALDEDTDSKTMNLSKKFTVGKDTDDETKYTKDDYKMVFQGLVIPQVAAYQDVAVDGSNMGTSITAPYIRIVYTLDGEEFTNYYNLAEVFSDVLAPYTKTKDNGDGTTTTYTAYYTSINNVYVYYNETATDKYVDKDFVVKTVAPYYYDGTSYYEESTGTSGKYVKVDTPTHSGTYDVVLMCTAKAEPTDATLFTCTTIPVTRKEADLDGVAETECDITFCEGWQNNLWITIHPTAILFDADVYKWDTWTPEYDYPVE